MLDLDIRTNELVDAYFNMTESEAALEIIRNFHLRAKLGMYTEQKLRETLAYATKNSSFYREKYGEQVKFPGSHEFAAAFKKLPYTDEKDLRKRGRDMLCVRPSEISRIVTLPDEGVTMETSGTTGEPKRVYFTEEDQQLTIDFFNHGMRLIVDESDKVLILMPAKIPGSIGLLLGQGLKDLGAEAIEYGLPDFRSNEAGAVEEILNIIAEENVTSIVGLPTHMIRLAREAEKRGLAGPAVRDGIQLRSILLSAEYVPDKTMMLLEEIFGCCVYEHYGMTEMGLGCAVSCGYGRGYHVREADLYIELINPITGQVVEGEGRKPGYSNYGEIVFTTLTRKGMPFIRYRTGDFSRWILEPCPCGSVLKRLDKVAPREEKKGGL
ncbi:MAG: DVU_1553 family AMP-dependent CoA ligase [Lentihominibacter sp.]|jgi:phenylacetate-CoA ligase